MPQRIGEYRHRIVIQQRSDTLDAAGEARPSWSEYATRWAKRRILSGNESFEGDVSRESELQVEFRTHQTRGVGPRMRVLYPGKVTTLAAAATSATTTSLTVASADGFPLKGKYRIRLSDELMEVTAGQGTTSWTVSRGVDGTTAGTGYATGTNVQHMQVYGIQAAHVDWTLGAETVMRARLIDGIA